MELLLVKCWTSWTESRIFLLFSFLLSISAFPVYFLEHSQSLPYKLSIILFLKFQLSYFLIPRALYFVLLSYYPVLVLWMQYFLCFSEENNSRFGVFVHCYCCLVFLSLLHCFPFLRPLFLLVLLPVFHIEDFPQIFSSLWSSIQS